MKTVYIYMEVCLMFCSEAFPMDYTEKLFTCLDYLTKYNL